MPKYKQALQLLSQMIEISEGVDKENMTKDSTSPKGEGWYTFHLKKLRELLEDDGDS